MFSLGGGSKQGYEPYGLITILICSFPGQKALTCQKLIDILIHALLVLSQMLGEHEETYKFKEDFS